METCERAARKRGCDRLRLEVRETNRPAIALYESLGLHGGSGATKTTTKTALPPSASKNGSPREQ